uniref:Uncharacterized protein n=1 Tax=Ananas comosus var. bracteatus TaxID=296719 RepID=A0A6V7QYG9_ANACO
MSSYENVVPGKLKLKGKALDVKAGGIKKKKKHKHHQDGESQSGNNELQAGGSSESLAETNEDLPKTEKLGAKKIHRHMMNTSRQLRDDILNRGRESTCIGWQRPLINHIVTGLRGSISILRTSASIMTFRKSVLVSLFM